MSTTDQTKMILDSISSLRIDFNSAIASLDESVSGFDKKLEVFTQLADKALKTAKAAQIEAVAATTKVDALSQRVSALEAALKQNNIDKQKMHDKALQLESYSRRDNLLFEGIPETKGENCLDIIMKVLKDDMRIDPTMLSHVQLSRVHRMGDMTTTKHFPGPSLLDL